MRTFISKKDLGKWGGYVLLPLMVGVMVYRFFRKKKAGFFGDERVIELPTINYLLFSLPSLLWSFALTSSLLLVWQPVNYTERKWLLVVAVATSMLFEAAQAANFIAGTFDWWDIIFSLAGCLASSLIFKKSSYANHA